MFTVFATPHRRFRTENGLRFWLVPQSVQLATGSDEIDADDISLNLIFESIPPVNGFNHYLREVPDFDTDVLTRIVPQPIRRPIIETRFNTEKHQGYLIDMERAFDSQSLSVAVSWSDSKSLGLFDFLQWVSGHDVEMPQCFWLSTPPEISLVKSAI